MEQYAGLDVSLEQTGVCVVVYRILAEGEVVRLISSTSERPKGGHPPACRSSRRAIRSPW
jgi:hypothetical protein